MGMLSGVVATDGIDTYGWDPGAGSMSTGLTGNWSVDRSPQINHVTQTSPLAELGGVSVRYDIDVANISPV